LVLVSKSGVVAAGLAFAARTVFSTTAAVVAGVGLLGEVTVDVVAEADVPTVVDESAREASVVPTTTARPLGCCTIAPRKAKPRRIQTVASAALPRLMVGDALPDARST
jgi:hypothetical protein